MRDVRNSSSESGMALLLALLVLAIMSGVALIFSQLAKDASLGERIALHRAQNAELAEGALHAALHQLARDDVANWVRQREGEISVEIKGRSIAVSATDACGRLGLNYGSLAVLEALIAEKVVSEGTSQLLQTLTRLRNEGHEFSTLTQLSALPGVGEGLYRSLQNELTVHCRSDDVDPLYASPALNRAAGEAAPLLLRQGPGQIFRLSTQVSAGPGTLVSMEAYVAFSSDPSHPLRLLKWESSE